MPDSRFTRKTLSLAALALALSSTVAGAQELLVTSFGGAYQDGQSKALYAHKVFESVDAAVAAVDQLKAHKDVFFNIHSLAEARVWNPKKVDWKTKQLGAYEVRVQSNMLKARALFFDLEWRSLLPKFSYGHDIEASWLFWEAAVAVGDAALLARTKTTALALADGVLAHGLDADGAVLYDGDATGPLNTDKHWWPQAEAIVGFLNAWQLSGKLAHLDAALRAWDFTEKHVVDPKHGEWFAVLERSGKPYPDYPAYADSQKIGPWKCPYHNGRACLEVLRRVPVAG